MRNSKYKIESIFMPTENCQSVKSKARHKCVCNVRTCKELYAFRLALSGFFPIQEETYITL